MLGDIIYKSKQSLNLYPVQSRKAKSGFLDRLESTMLDEPPRPLPLEPTVTNNAGDSGLYKIVL